MWRRKLLLIFFIVSTLAILSRLFYWQVILKNQLLATAGAQYGQILQISASRGEILASDLSPLAVNQTAFLVYGQPAELGQSPKSVAAKLAPILASINLPAEADDQREEKIAQIESDLITKLSNEKLFWVALARKVPSDIKEKIENLNLTGIGFIADEARFYPEASMAAHLLGFVASDAAGADTGYFGLEGHYNSQLKGRPGVVVRERDAAGLPILLGKFEEVRPADGLSLVTTLDRIVQSIVEEKLKKGVEKYGARQGSVVVANPKTGAILAMASYPAYDALLRDGISQEVFKNPIIADDFEPGSIFKLIVMAGALNEKIVEPESVCGKCDGSREIGGYTIRTWNNKYFPNSTASEILIHSDNVGMVEIGEKLGKSKFLRYLKRFEFGKPTGIDLQEEVTAAIREDSEWKPIDLATASFGQGIAVTMIKMVQAVSAIANGGQLLQPYIVSQITGGKRQFKVEPKIIGEVMTSRTASVLTEMMVAAVEKGEAKFFAPADFKIAGKTGTAQIPIAGHYDPEKTIASFIGFAPGDNPKFVMMVRYVEPSTSPYGSETAAPTFFEIAKELFAYFGISPKQ